MNKDKRFKIYIAAYLMLIKDDQILLLKRAHTGYQDGNYSLIAGHLDGGETAKQSIIRETEEEAGIQINENDLDVLHIMHRYNPDREYIDIFLKTEKWSGEIVNKEPEKCAELAWFPIDQLPDNIIPEVKLAIENAMTKNFYSESGWE